jgi:hypothetical protein
MVGFNIPASWTAFSIHRILEMVARSLRMWNLASIQAAAAAVPAATAAVVAAVYISISLMSSRPEMKLSKAVDEGRASLWSSALLGCGAETPWGKLGANELKRWEHLPSAISTNLAVLQLQFSKIN